jgi:predicted nucleic acid-binding protein
MNNDASSRVYLDANVFILLVEGEPEQAGIIRELFDVLRKSRNSAVTSELTLGEVLAPPRRKGALELHLKRRLYLDLMIWSRFIELVPVSRDLLIETADLRQVSRHKLPDAVHVVTAVRSRCTYFLSNDVDGKRVPNQMQWLRPDVQGIATLLEALRA